MKNLNIKVGSIATVCLLAATIYLLLPEFVDTADAKKIDVENKISATVSNNTKENRTQPPTNQQPPAPNLQNGLNSCHNHYLPNKNLAQWRQTTQASIATFFAGLEQTGTDRVTLEKVAIESGVGLFRGRKLLSGYQKYTPIPRFAKDNVHLANYNETLLVKVRLEANDLTGLARDITEGKISPNAFYAGKDSLVFLLSYVLESQTDNQVNVIENLVDSGIKVFYSDLETLSQLNIPQATVDKLVKASDLQVNQVLKRFGRYTSLALLAIEAKNPTLANYWIAMGSPVKPDLFFDNAMDKLAKNGSTMDKTELDILFEQLAKQGLTPYWPANIDKLKEMITPQLLNKFDINKITTTELSKSQLNEIDTIVNRLHTKLLNKVVDFDVNSHNKHPCFDQLGLRSTKYAMSYKPKPKERAKKRPNPNKRSINPVSANRIAKAKELFGDDQQIEEHLGKGQGAEGKQDVNQFRRMKLTELVASSKLNSPSKPAAPVDQQKMDEIIQLANEGKWQEAVAKLERLEIPEDEIATILLSIALYAQVDFSIMMDLLSKGASLPSNTLKWLIVKDNVALAKQLLPYGLDLNYTFMGDSSLAMSVKRRAIGMLNFLIENGVPIDSYSAGFDALDHALRQFDLNKGGVSYIDTLIKAGAKIELSHKQTVDSMRLINMVAYFKLTSTWPDFKM